MKTQKPSFRALAGTILAFSGLAAPCLAKGGGAPAIFPPSVGRGAIVYSKACAACHGDKGDGLGPGAAALNPKPRDFTTGQYKFRSTGTGELPTDADLLRVVNDGVYGTQMPGWKNVLTEQERLDVVAYIKAFSEDFKNSKPDTIEVPEAPEASPKLIEEGRQVFVTLQCWSCHGTQGRGDGSAAVGLMDFSGHPIKPANFTAVRYKRGNDPQSIYKTINTGLNGTPMPSFADAFLFGGDKAVDSATAASFSAEEVQQLRDYLKAQPFEAVLIGLGDEKKKELALRRKWALAHYVHSLVRKGSFFHWLWEDAELTR